MYIICICYIHVVYTDKPTNSKYEEKMNKKRKTKTSLLGQA